MKRLEVCWNCGRAREFIKKCPDGYLMTVYAPCHLFAEGKCEYLKPREEKVKP